MFITNINFLNVYVSFEHKYYSGTFTFLTNKNVISKNFLRNVKVYENNVWRDKSFGLRISPHSHLNSYFSKSAKLVLVGIL